MAKAIWEDDQFYLQALDIEEQIETRSEVEQYVSQLLQESGNLFISEIKAKAKNDNYTAAGIDQAIKELVKIGLINRTNEGGRGKAAEYGINKKSM